jgi:hypothetical protein
MHPKLVEEVLVRRILLELDAIEVGRPDSENLTRLLLLEMGMGGTLSR